MDKKRMKPSLLIMIHCEQHTGYAVGVLEKVFYEAGLLAGYTHENIYWSFPKVYDSSKQIIECQFKNLKDPQKVIGFIKENNIQQVLAFDLGYPSDVLPLLYQAGVKHITSYWGASMSSINTGIKLMLKKLEWKIRRYKPHHFIFESEAMQLTATQGRGVPSSATKVISLGVDTEKFFPAYQQSYYAHDVFGLSKNTRIIFYSGHMEERKGVRIIVQAAIQLIDKQKYTDVHFVICGNKNNEADTYLSLLENTQAKQHVTFAGYRNDIAELMRSSSVGVIASTGWDSFTMSSVEMMASGLPLIVSNLQGLSETIEDNINGFLIPPGDAIELAQRIMTLTTNADLAEKFSRASRLRAENLFSQKKQIEQMAQSIKEGRLKKAKV
jgi:glycosyltransferase involved in cell wall biosynthesis